MNIMDENQTNVESSGNGIWEFVKVVIISLLIVIPVRTWVAQPFIVDGSSMVPTYHNGEYLIIDELTYELSTPERGQVIVFRYPINPSEFFIKRIIGLPGETVEIKNSKVLIHPADSDQTIVLDESYLPKNLQTGPDETVKLEAGQYFVMGDNRTASSDSRFWGVLPRNNITGKVFLRLWPLTKAGFVN